MYILGINAAYHESAACLLHNGRIVAAVEEERFSRVKHAKPARVDNPHELPLHAIQHCLEAAGIGPTDVAYIGFSIAPQRRQANKHLGEPVVAGDWGSAAGEDMFLERVSRVPGACRDLGLAGEFIWLEHHLCHAGSAFYASPFAEAAVLCVDGIGEFGTAAFAHGQGSALHVFQETSYPASLGFLWEKVAKFLGFSEYDACKVMGLASYGDAAAYRDRFDAIVELGPAGGFMVDNDVLRFRVEDYAALEALFGLPRRTQGQPLAAQHQQIAAAMQQATGDVLLHMARHLHAQTGSANLCLAGGVALNCVGNRVLYEQGPFAHLYAQPAAHDAGTAIGAAYVIWHALLGRPRAEGMPHAYLGPAFSDDAIEQALQSNRLVYERVDAIEARVAELLCQGQIVGWFQGAMEIGPRALGNRSLLADPRDPQMQDLLNTRIKHREPFRPFAPSVLAEQAEQWFMIGKPTPASDFMMVTYPARPEVRELIPAVVHVDGTSRVQTVRQATNPRYHRLISEFFRRTGVPLLLNTSFNDNEPIVCSPQHAINTFQKTQIDYLAIGPFLVERGRQVW